MKLTYLTPLLLGTAVVIAGCATSTTRYAYYDPKSHVYKIYTYKGSNNDYTYPAVSVDYASGRYSKGGYFRISVDTKRGYYYPYGYYRSGYYGYPRTYSKYPYRNHYYNRGYYPRSHYYGSHYRGRRW